MESQLPEAHPNLSAEINDRIQQIAIEGGADLTLLRAGRKLKVQTRNTLYEIERVSDDDEDDYPFLISGHPRICPKPKRAAIPGSSFDGGMLRMKFVGRSMNLEFTIESESKAYITSRISEVREIVTTAGGAVNHSPCNGGQKPC